MPRTTLPDDIENYIHRIGASRSWEGNPLNPSRLKIEAEMGGSVYHHNLMSVSVLDDLIFFCELTLRSTLFRGPRRQDFFRGFPSEAIDGCD